MSYAGSQAQSGRGTVIAIGATPTAIGECSDFPLNRSKWETADVTNFSSGSDGEFIATIRKPGSVNIKGNRVVSDAGQVLVEAAYQSGAISAFTVTLPKTVSQSTSGDKYTFNALVLSLDFSIQPTKQIEFSLDLQISGPVTFTAGT
jgi:hypothetical protein